MAKRPKAKKTEPPKAESKPDVYVQMVPLSHLEKWPRNPKLHDLDGIKASIAKFGFTQPIVIDERSHKMVAGHGRLEALSQLKAAGAKLPARVQAQGDEWLVPVLRGIKFESEKDAEEYLLADNRLTETGGWDYLIAVPIFEQFPNEPPIGWGAADVARLIESARGAVVTDPAAEYTGMPEYKNEDKTSFRKILVHFKTQADVDKFAKAVKQKIIEQTRFIWFPVIVAERERDKSYVEG
jgi:hypothetical protein